jgi:hypothetical protein
MPAGVGQDGEDGQTRLQRRGSGVWGDQLAEAVGVGTVSFTLGPGRCGMAIRGCDDPALRQREVSAGAASNN